MSAAHDPMTRVDTAWRRMDTDVNLMMIVGVWIIEPRLPIATMRERVRTRMLRYRRFRQKVVVGTFGADWVDDDDFDIDRHVIVEKLQRRPGQSARSALQQRMGELASTPLDPAHPLWAFHYFEDYDGGSASVCRIHHCIGDGLALNSVMMAICDDGAVPPEVDGPANGHEGTDRHRGDLVADELLKPLTGLAVKAIDLTGDAVAKSLHWLAHPGEALAAARDVAADGVQLATDVAALALLPDDSKTRLKGHGSGKKVVAWCEPLPLEPVKAVGKALGASINDVLLCCVAGAIGRYLRDQGDDTTGCDIRAMVPVNLRPLSEAWQLGNRFGLVPLLVPAGIENPIERLGVVHARMQALKESYQPVLAYGLLALSGLLVEPGQKALSSLFLDKTTAVMTNVPGPPLPLRLGGSAVRQSIFWVPASGDVGMGVSIISYAGGVEFGLITDQLLCPHPERIIDRFGDEFEKLLLLTMMLPWDGLAAARPGHAAT
jgi:WS/DGAT/MGAT family acyltransferase